MVTPHTPRARPDRRAANGDGGFTLIELLVVMVVIGVLAAIAVPAFLGNRARAQEVAAKSDVKQIAKEVIAFYVDGKGPMTVQNSTDGRSWLLLDDAGTDVATGPLSQRNAVVTSGVIASDSVYCISIQADGLRAWQATPNGLALGTC